MNEYIIKTVAGIYFMKINNKLIGHGCDKVATCL